MKLSLERIMLIFMFILLFSLVLALRPTNSQSDFQVYTSAVCEENQENVLCQDKLVVQCGDIDYVIPSITLGSITHNKDWVDPRAQE